MSSAIQVPLRDILIELNDPNRKGVATKIFQDFLLNMIGRLPSYTPLIATDFGLGGKGTSDDTAGLQKAVDQAASIGGATILMPPGVYSIGSVRFPSGNAPVTLMGFGDATVLRRRSVLADGLGMLDLRGSSVTLDNLLLDGNVTTPIGLLYNGGFSTPENANDPMATSLTKNSTVWIHGGAGGFTFRNVKWMHTGGYAVLIDARSGGIFDVRLIDDTFLDNRPHLFGTVAGQEIFGSWTSGVFVSGDGRSTNPGRVLKGLRVTGCEFQRNTGNQCWSHLLGLDELHEDFQIALNNFLDIGLDAIEIGGVNGGQVTANVMRRIGYTTLTDTDRSVPRWMPNRNAVGIDSSGLVIGVNYQGNSIMSPNGAGLDLDGHSDSALLGNTVRVPVAGDPDYEADQIAISGVNNNGSSAYGINLGNTSNTPFGGKNVTIEGNTLLNLSVGAVRLYAARDCLVMGNNIVAPDQPLGPPIALGPGGPGANQRSTGNVIKHNRCYYNPAIPVPFVFEDPTVAPFTGSDQNFVFGNCPILGAGGLATEFQKDPSSSSPTFAETVWF